jgi:O-antigen/teichoic acid export membrane protein
MSAYQEALAGTHHASVFRETLHAGHVHGTFILLTSLDVLLARHTLSSHDAGVYAVGSVVTRATVWLPQSVIMLMFASLAESHRHRTAARRASEIVAGIGAVCVAGCALFGNLVVTVVGGSKYHALDDTIWLYALLGALLAIVQLAMLAGLAQRNPRRVALLWATIAADVVLTLANDVQTPTDLVVRLVSVTAVAAVAAFWLTRRQVGSSAGQGDGVYVGSNPAPKPDETPAGTG